MNRIAQKRIQELEKEIEELRNPRKKEIDYRVLAGQIAIFRVEPNYPVELQR